MRRLSGFTVIELVVVILVLGILGTLVAFAYSGVQTNNRDNQRQADIDTLQSHLEVIYAQTDAYPTIANLNDQEWRKANLPEAQTNTFQDPKWAANEACTVNDTAVMSAEPAADCYSYQVTTTDGSPCDNNEHPCSQYTLTATLENGTTYVKTSLN